MSHAPLSDPFPPGAAPVLLLLSPEEEDGAVRRAAAFLSRYRRLNHHINSRLAFRQRLMEIATRISSAPPGLAEGRGSASGDRLGDAVARLADLEREIDRDVDRLVDLKEEIWCLLDRLENPEAALLLDDYYIAGMTMKKAAARAGYDERYAYRLRRHALIQISRFLDARDAAAG